MCGHAGCPPGQNSGSRSVQHLKAHPCRIFGAQVPYANRPTFHKRCLHCSRVKVPRTPIISLMTTTKHSLESSFAIRPRIMADNEAPELLTARFEELSVLETDFENIELEISKYRSHAKSDATND